MLFPMVFLAFTTAVEDRRARIALGFADVATVGVATGKAVTHLAVGGGSLVVRIGRSLTRLVVVPGTEKKQGPDTGR